MDSFEIAVSIMRHMHRNILLPAKSYGLLGAILSLTLLAPFMPAQKAEAAAWPREEGQHFLTLSYESTVDGPDFGSYASLYYEYGLTEKLTFGVDVGKNSNIDQISGIAFLRYPLDLTRGVDVFAIELGVGGAERDGSTSAALRPGFSWGRPIEGPWGAGWLGIESSYAFYDDGGGLGKVDGTFGINHDNGSLTILKLEYAAPLDGRSTFAFAPSHALKISEKTFLEFGVSHEFDQSVSKAKVGFWLRF